MVKQGKIQVEGHASRWVPADHADVTFTVTRRARTSGAAVAEAGEAYAALDAALAAHTDVIVRRTTTSLTVHEIVHYEPKSGRPIREGFEASRTQTARFAPLSGAGAALRSIVVSVTDLVVRGPEFGLAPTNPVHSRVRSEASAAARASAAAYAIGLGLSLGPVLSLTESRPGGIGYDAAAGGFAVRSRMKAAPEDGGESILVDLTEEDVEVSASIELEIAIAAPAAAPAVAPLPQRVPPPPPTA